MISRFKRVFNKNALLLIILSGVLLRIIRLFLLKDDFLNWDELMPISWNFSYYNISGLVDFLLKNDPHPPLFTLISRLFVFTGISPFFCARIINFVVSTLCVFLVYHLSMLFFNKRDCALYSALFFVLNTTILYESTRVRPYLSFVMFALICNIFFIRLFRSGRTLDRVLYILSSIFMYYIHFFGGFIITGHFVYSVVKKRLDVKMFFTFLGSFVFFLPYLLSAYNSPLNPHFYQEAIKNHISWINKIDYFRFLYDLADYLLGIIRFEVFDYYFLSNILFFVILFLYIKRTLELKNRKEIFYILVFPGLFLFIIGVVYQTIFDQGFLEKTHLTFLVIFFGIIFGTLKKRIRTVFILIMILINLLGLFKINMNEMTVFNQIKNQQDSNIKYYIYPRYYYLNVESYFKDLDYKVEYMNSADDLPENIQNNLSDQIMIVLKDMGEVATGKKTLEKMKNTVINRFQGHISEIINIHNILYLFKISKENIPETQNTFVDADVFFVNKKIYIITDVVKDLFIFYFFFVFYKDVLLEFFKKIRKK